MLAWASHLPGAFLCGVCTFFLCLHGLPQDTPALSYSPKPSGLQPTPRNPTSAWTHGSGLTSVSSAISPSITMWSWRITSPVITRQLLDRKTAALVVLWLMGQSDCGWGGAGEGGGRHEAKGDLVGEEKFDCDFDPAEKKGKSPIVKTVVRPTTNQDIWNNELKILS